MWRPSSRALFWISEAGYIVLVLITGCFFAISLAALLSQAVRTAPDGWTNNWNAVSVGATYVFVVRINLFSDLICTTDGLALLLPSSSWFPSRSV